MFSEKEKMGISTVKRYSLPIISAFLFVLFLLIYSEIGQSNMV